MGTQPGTARSPYAWRAWSGQRRRGVLDARMERLVTKRDNDDLAYRFPLGHGLTVELRFIGVGRRAADIEILRAYLDLFRAALEPATRRQ